MTTRDLPPPPLDPRPRPRRRIWPHLELSATQLVATALAAITATIAASYLGVSGTVIGAALASVVSAVGNAVYGHSLRSTRDRVRGRDPQPPAPTSSPAPTSAPASAEPRPSRPGHPRPRWRGAAIGAAAVFAAVLALVTGVELVAGRPLSDLIRGDAGSGTSVFGGGQAQGGTTGQVPTITRTVTPSVVVTTPTVTQTAPAVTRTAAPTVRATPTSTPTPGPSGSATTGSGSATPSAGLTSTPAQLG